MWRRNRLRSARVAAKAIAGRFRSRDGAGFVTRFKVRRAFLSGYEVQQAGGKQHQEYWIPADDLQAFNEAIIDAIEVTAEFR